MAQNPAGHDYDERLTGDIRSGDVLPYEAGRRGKGKKKKNTSGGMERLVVSPSLEGFT